jgi:hypothetical protein
MTDAELASREGTEALRKTIEEFTKIAFARCEGTDRFREEYVARLRKAVSELAEIEQEILAKYP